MKNDRMCESCDVEMEVIFVITKLPLYVISGERVLKFIHTTGEDVFQNKWWGRWVPSMAKYIMGFRCASCQTMLLNYGKTYSEKEVQGIVKGD